MKNIKVLSALSAGILGFSACAYAAPLINTPVSNSSTDTMRIAGTTELAEDYVNIVVYNPDGKIGYAEQLNSDSSKAFDRTVLLEGGSGAYRIDVRTYEGVESFTVNHSSAADMKKIIEIVNTAASADDVKAKIFDNDNYSKILKQDEERFKSLKDKTILYEMLCAGKPYDSENTAEYARVDEILAAAAVVGAVNEAENISEIKTILEENDGLFGIKSTAAYSVLSKDYETAEAYDKAMSGMLKQNYRSVKAVKQGFIDASASAAIVCLNDRMKTNELFSDLGYSVDNEKYAKLSSAQKAEIANSLKNGGYKTADSAYNAFAQMVSDAKIGTDSGGTSTNRPSGGGGGSGTGGGGFTIGSEPKDPNGSGETKPEEKPLFGDLTEAEWARDAVMFLNRAGIVSGYEDGSFRPNNLVTREEFAKLAVTAAGLGTSEYDGGFTDVSASDWFAGFIASASQKNLIGGIGGGMFGTGSHVTREDAACIIFRTLNYKGLCLEIKENTFADADNTSAYAQDAIGTLSANKIINGMGDNMFAPKNNLTRAESAMLIHAMVLEIEKSGEGK